MQEEDELRKEIAEKKKIMEKEFGSAPMNEQQFKGKSSYFFDVLLCGAIRGVNYAFFLGFDKTRLVDRILFFVRKSA